MKHCWRSTPKLSKMTPILVAGEQCPEGPAPYTPPCPGWLMAGMYVL